MNIFLFFAVVAVRAKREESDRYSDEDFFNCGGFIEFSSEMTSVEISSPKDYSGYNGHYTYPFNSLCEWVIKDECAEGFYINPIKFDIEGNDEKIRKELHFYSLRPRKIHFYKENNLFNLI